jgi:HD-GYP domain-containing protein (c-di-GMP phosphodiesterase class II)
MDSGTKSGGLERVEVEDLSVGMYVAKLDRPWLETSFLLQGFYVRSQETIEQLAAECGYVYIDPRRVNSSANERKLRLVVSNPDKRESSGLSQSSTIAPSQPQTYTDRTELTEEIHAAQTSVEEAIQILEGVVHKLQSTGGVDIADIEAAVRPIVSSVMRNKDAIAALLRIKRIDDYTYSHAISSAVWASVLGRELGFSPEDIDTLAVGCATADIGKTKLDRNLLVQTEKPTEDQWEQIKGHPEEGVHLLKASGVQDPVVLAMIESHHERHDGSGYPLGLSGNSIPVFGRIAGIIDSYDAMITERPYAAARSSFGAVMELQKQADVLFQKELVDYFIKAIGVFPVGTVVELSTGEVGIVIGQDSTRRLRPKVMLILDENKQSRNEMLITDLGTVDTDPSKTLSVWITKELPQTAYGIDPTEYFL